MKKILLIVGLLASTMTYAGSDGSNAAGTIHGGISSGLVFGGCKFSEGSDDPSKGGGFVTQYGLRASYGITNLISAGIFIRKEGAAYLFEDFGSGIIAYSGYGFGLEGKFYAVNSETLNIYAAPAFGFTTATLAGISSGLTSTSISGLNYALLAGGNYYFHEISGITLGANFDLGLSGFSLGGKLPKDEKFTLSSTGLYIGVGVVAKLSM